MTIKAKEIIDDARYTLADTDKDRWSDSRLLKLLNHGISDIAKYTTLFVEDTLYKIQNNVVDIDMSNISTKIVRAEYLGVALPLYSFEQMDEKCKDWQKHRDTKVKAIVYGHQRNGLVKQYPIVENSVNDLITYTGSYGIVTGITHSDLTEIRTEEIFGDLADLPSEGVIKFYYVRDHKKVVDINEVLDIDELVAPMLKHYVTGMALRDNQDTQNRALGNEELGLYSTMREKYEIEKENSFVRPDYTIPYNAEGV